MSGDQFPNYEQWRVLTTDQQSYLLWQSLNELSMVPQRYAAKWTEKAFIAVATIILSSFLYAVINYIIPGKAAGSSAAAARSAITAEQPK